MGEGEVAAVDVITAEVEEPSTGPVAVVVVVTVVVAVVGSAVSGSEGFFLGLRDFLVPSRRSLSRPKTDNSARALG